MGKIWVEVCLISARGLRRTSSLWKLQWFAVGWIDPENKYCTNIDASGNGNPTWKTRFSVPVDASEQKLQELALQVEVYSREPIFLRSSLSGTATIVLKEFLDKYNAKSEVAKPVEEVGSFQLRKKKSNKPQGFVDISIRISEEGEDPGSAYPAGEEGFNLTNHGDGINLATGYGPIHPQRSHLHLSTPHQPESTNPMPIPPNYIHHHSATGPNYTAAAGPSYQPSRTPPPPPPPPSNAGHISNFFPRTDNLRPVYMNMPSSAVPAGHGARPNFGMGVGAGALAAGSFIFGDNFMSGFQVPGGSRDASLTISTNPPF